MEMSEESRTLRDEQRIKYGKMDKRAKDKLDMSPREIEEDRMPKKIFTQELEGTRGASSQKKKGLRHTAFVWM